MTVSIEKFVWSTLYEKMVSETSATFASATDEICIYQPDLTGKVVLDFADLEKVYKKIKKLRKKKHEH